MQFTLKSPALFAFCGLTALLLSAVPTFAQAASSTSPQAPLVQILQAKGILSAADVASINQAGSADASNATLEKILLSKGLISQSDFDKLTGDNAPPVAVLQPQSRALAKQASASAGFAGGQLQSPPHPTEPGAPGVIAQAPPETVNQAVVPVRVFPVGGVKSDRTPAIKTAGRVGIDPYGFIKATLVEDSSSPQGDDFPLPGFLTPTDPSGDPEFHIKARSTRMGLSMSWYDPSSRWNITGKIEMDFEGNFNRSDNRNLSSVRSSNPSLRLAYGRIDYHFNSDNTLSALFGQDWALYGSSTLPNLLETTGLGIDFGSLYERLPQMRAGFTHKAGDFAIMPEFGIELPASGLVPDNVTQQIGYGEQTGPNSDKPEYTGRLVLQYQLDHAAGVPPAQIIFSGTESRTGSDVTGGNVSAATATGIVTAPGPCTYGSTVCGKYAAAFPNGYSARSSADGWDVEWQLPARWATLVGKFYSGSDLFFYFAGQLQSYYNDTRGLTDPIAVADTDGAAPLGSSASTVLGTNAGGQVVVAPQRPVRSQGGFAQLGLPLGRLFNANPAGRNAGWTLFATYGVDQAKHRDLDTEYAEGFGSPIQDRYSTMAIGTLNYKMNKWVSYSYEQSLYTTHCNMSIGDAGFCTYRGNPAREWNDVREEFGPIFVF